MGLPRFRESDDDGIDSHEPASPRLSGFRYCRSSPRVARLHDSSWGDACPVAASFCKRVPWCPRSRRTARSPARRAPSAQRGASRSAERIYDDRYAEGRRFAEVVATHGVPTRALDDGDITRFWYDELETLWKREPFADRGLHAVRPDVRRRAARARARHARRAARRALQPRPTARWSIASRARARRWRSRPGFETLHVGLARADRGARLQRRRRRFAAASAELATAALAPSDRPSAAPGAPSVIHYYTPLAVQQGHGPALDGPLYSWVVAPRARVTR